jgi:O-antigen ligase
VLFSLFWIPIVLESSRIYTDKKILYPILIIFVLFITQIFVSPEWNQPKSEIIRATSFILFSVFIILYFSYVVEFEYFLHIVVILSSLVVGIGLLGMNVTLGSNPTLINQTGLVDYKLVFTNPNALGNLTKYGVVSGVILYYRKQSKRILLLVSISLIGLILSQGISEIIAGVSCIILYWLYQTRSSRTFQLTAGIGLATGIILFLWVLLDPNNWIARLFLPRRRFLWSASLEAISQKPFFGYGLGYTGDYIEPTYNKSAVASADLNPDMYLSVHNSFLRIFLSIGLIGGLSYVYLFVRGIYLKVFSKPNWKDAGITCLMICVITSHMFQAYLIFGLRMQSVFAAIILGFSLQNQKVNDDDV